MFTKDEKKGLRLRFWGAFKKMSAERRLREGRPKEWILKRTGIKGLSLRFDMDREHAAVGFELWRKDKFEEALLFERLESLRTIMESILGEGIIWDEEFITPEGRQCSRIYQKLDGVDMYKTQDWPVIQDFFYSKMTGFETIFLEYKDILD